MYLVVLYVAVCIFVNYKFKDKVLDKYAKGDDFD